MTRSIWVLSGMLFCLACTPLVPQDTPLCSGVDLREQYDVIYPDGLALRVPSLLIPAGEERVWCWYGTWEGPDSGIVSFHRRASSQFLHHLNLKSLSATDPHPDGTLIDCTSLEEQATHGTDLIAEMRSTDGGNELALPPGVAVSLPSGSRWVADIHYVNTSTEPICVNAAYDFELTPADQVEAMAAAIELDVGNYEIPPGEVTLRTECEVPVDMDLLAVAGHMHDRGTRFQVETIMDESTEPVLLYAVDPWLSSYQYEPPLTLFETDEVHLQAGDTLVMDCTWNNETNTPLTYPEEMCQTRAVAYPLDSPMQCVDGTWYDANGSPMGDFGTLSGSMSRSVESTEDGRGDALIVVSTTNNFGEDAVLVRTFNDSDLSQEGAPLPYVLEGLPLSSKPLFVTAFFDDDDSGFKDGPEPGDLSAPTYQVVCETTEPVTLDIVFDSHF